MLRTFLIVASLLLATAASADIVRLKSGGKVEGIVTHDGNQVVIELPYGVFRVDKADVVGIEKGRTPLERYREQAAELKADDVDGHLALARWCEERRLNSLAEKEFLKILDIDPDHEMARRALGYERYEGKWLTREEVMEAKGFVRHEGEWITLEERAAREALRAQEEARRREEAAERAREERERARAREAEEAAARAAEERYRAENYARYSYTTTTSPYYYGNGYWPYYSRHIDYRRSFTDSATGARIVVVRHPNGTEQWYAGNPSTGTLIHTSGDGHCTEETSGPGGTTKSHFPNGTCTGAPDQTITD